MKRALLRFFAWTFGLVGFVCLCAFGWVVYQSRHQPKIPDQVILEFNLEGGFSENVSDHPLARALEEGKSDIRVLVRALEQAEKDPRVLGMVAHIGAGSFAMAHVQELRDAVSHFRSKGKFAVAFSETFGEFGPGMGGYYLATAFDTIWLQPSGDVGLTGIVMESPFFKGALDKFGVLPQLDHRKEYKSAMNLFTEKKYTPAHKEMMTSIMNSWFSQIVDGIAQGRHSKRDQVIALVDQGPLSAKEALLGKWVDQLGYREDCYSKVKQMAGAKAELLYAASYVARLEPPSKKAKTLALIYGLGNVTRGQSEQNPFRSSSNMGSDTITAAFRAAVLDPEVKAIVFRIDSPGGSYVASDAIWQEVVRAKAAGKPVIVSMGNMAGSGGYFVAMAANKIVAEPGTLTGSIGVFGGKMVPAKLLNDLGITFDEVHVGKNATMWSMASPYTESEWKQLQRWLDRVYEDFTEKVAKERHLPLSDVLQIAKGRVFTGEEAKKNGLVDELGGMSTAISLAKKTANISDDEEVKLESFPKSKTAIELFIDRLMGKEPSSSEQGLSEVALIKAIQAAKPTIQLLEQSGVLGHPEVLEMDMPKAGHAL